MNNGRLYLLLILTCCIESISIASEVKVIANTLEVVPANLDATGICIKYEDTGTPYLRAYIRFPERFKDEKFDYAMITVNSGQGESTSIEVTPIFNNGFHEVDIIGVRYGEELTNVKLEAIYGDSSSIPLVLTIDLEDFTGKNERSSEKSD